MGSVGNSAGSILKPVTQFMSLGMGGKIGDALFGQSLNAPSAPTPTTPPVQSPLPSVDSSDAGNQMTAAQRMKKLQALRYGFASTITSRSPLSPQPSNSQPATPDGRAVAFKNKLGQ